MRQWAHTSGLDELHDAGRAGGQGVDLPADQRLHRGTRAGEGHVHHLDAGGVLQHFHRHVHRAVDARAAVAQLAALFPGRLKKFVQRLVGRVRAHHQHGGIGRDAGDRHKLVQLISGFAFQQPISRGQDGNRRQAHQQRVAIGLGAARLADADRAAGAALVFDDDRLAQLVAQGLGNRASDGVGHAAGREGHHQRDGAFGIAGGQHGHRGRRTQA